MTDLNKEREKYLQWHFENWKAKYAQDDAPEFAKTMYDRIYQHFHTDQISERESGFEAWLEAKAQAVPEGYVPLPKRATESMIEAGKNTKSAASISKNDVQLIYKAMVASESGAEG